MHLHRPESLIITSIWGLGFNLPAYLGELQILGLRVLCMCGVHDTVI